MALSDEIKERLDIVEVVESYVPILRKAGRSYKALCPFHSERTPSFVVFPERQSWRCFGACATGGDALSFVMLAEKLSFGDTLKLLAQRAGVAVPQLLQDERGSRAWRRRLPPRPSGRGSGVAGQAASFGPVRAAG